MQNISMNCGQIIAVSALTAGWSIFTYIAYSRSWELDYSDNHENFRERMNKYYSVLVAGSIYIMMFWRRF